MSRGPWGRATSHLDRWSVDTISIRGVYFITIRYQPRRSSNPTCTHLLPCFFFSFLSGSSVSEATDLLLYTHVGRSINRRILLFFLRECASRRRPWRRERAAYRSWRSRRRLLRLPKYLERLSSAGSL